MKVVKKSIVKKLLQRERGKKNPQYPECRTHLVIVPKKDVEKKKKALEKVAAK